MEKIDVNPFIVQPAPWPYYAEDEIEAVTQVLKSGKVNYWTGEHGVAFEQEFAAHLGVPYAVAVANGSVALELALYAIGIQEGDEVIVAPRTFMASVHAILLRGAIPVFADVDPRSGNITAETIERVMSSRTRAIIAVHLGGWPCEMEDIVALARAHGVKVVEDCAQAHGAMYRGKPVGSWGDVAAWSFCQDKIISTGGEGGMLTTASEEIWERAWSFKDHGKSYRAFQYRGHPAGGQGYYQQVGTNWRMTEMQAVIGRLQLKKLPLWIQRRRENAAILHRYLQTVDALETVWPPAHVTPSFYRYYAYLRPDRLPEGWNRDRIVQWFRKWNIPGFSGAHPLYQEPVWKRAPVKTPDTLSVARKLDATALMFAVHPTLTPEHMEFAGKTIAEWLTSIRD